MSMNIRLEPSIPVNLLKLIDNCVNIVVRNNSSYLSISLCWNSFGQRDLLFLQTVNYFFTKHYELTSRNNIFLASLLYVNYVKDMEDQFPPSNCVVHDDTFDWGG